MTAKTSNPNPQSRVSVHGHQTDRAALATVARRAMLEHGLEPSFPAKAQQEMQSITKAASAGEGMRDLRNLLWASIDNDDSRDLDQLTVAEPLEGDKVRILVAIADVDALVTKGSGLDAHAGCNTTSVYTPGGIFPMLPLGLSTDLTSLNENEDRNAIIIDMVVDATGSLVEHDVYLGVVYNHAKLAYHAVGDWLAGKGPEPERVKRTPGLEANLRLQDTVAQKLLLLRHSHGALSLETIEPRATFIGDALSDLNLDQKNRATQLIEEFMVAANGVIAVFLKSKGCASLRRVLRSPERWQRIVSFAAGFGDTLPDSPDSIALEGFLNRRKSAAPDKFPDLSLAVVKLIGRGEYALFLPSGTPPGHFGLAVQDYTHSTAPNRRFPDLITQRLLKAALAQKAPAYEISELQELAEHCTEREDAASKVERQVRKSAAALLLAHRIGERFEGIVTGASPKGTWVRLLHPHVEGRVTSGYHGLEVGKRVHLKLVHTDFDRGFVDFAHE